MEKYNPPTEQSRSSKYANSLVSLSDERKWYTNTWKRRAYDELCDALFKSGTDYDINDQDTLYTLLEQRVTGIVPNKIIEDARSYQSLCKKIKDVGLMDQSTGASEVFECLSSLLDGNIEELRNEGNTIYLDNTCVFTRDLTDSEIKEIVSIGKLQDAKYRGSGKLETMKVYEVQMKSAGLLHINNAITNRSKLLSIWLAGKLLAP